MPAGRRPLRVLRRILVWAGGVLGVFLLWVTILYFWASRGFDDTDPLAVRPEWIEGVRDWSAERSAGRAIRIVTWNIAYGRGWKDDAGDLRSEATIRANLAAIATALRALDADIVALQEVDFDAARSYGIDEVRFLAREAGYPWAARVETWRCRYVPWPYWPPSQHYGRMVSGQAVLSRYRIRSAERRLLPQPPNPFWYNAFYLHRAIEIVEIDLGRDRVIRVVNTHLEAFHQATREEHARILVNVVRPLLDRPAGVIVLGDMNAIPPEATLRARFPDEPETDMTTDRTIALIRDGLAMAEAIAEAGDPASTFTFPAHSPNRRLDYLYFSAHFERADGRVAREVGPLSDHLPVLADLKLADH